MKERVLSAVIALLIIMPFHLKDICYYYSMHPENSLGAWHAVHIQSTIYGFVVGILTVILVIINVCKNEKK